MINIAILRIFILSQLLLNYHRILICNSVRLFALVASKDGESETDAKLLGKQGKKIFWETQA
jgi:hypothetical protein